jgi:hypothetical protein
LSRIWLVQACYTSRHRLHKSRRYLCQSDMYPDMHFHTFYFRRRISKSVSGDLKYPQVNVDGPTNSKCTSSYWTVTKLCPQGTETCINEVKLHLFKNLHFTVEVFNYQQDKWIVFSPMVRPESIFDVTVNSRFRHSQVRHTFWLGTKICWMDPLLRVFPYIRDQLAHLFVWHTKFSSIFA